MAAELADVGRCKRYLRIPEPSPVDDQVIAELLASVIAMIETYLATLAAARGASLRASTWPSLRSYRGPNDLTSSVTVITLASLEEEDDYESRILPALNQYIVDTVAMFYQQRNPTAVSESEGGGVSESWDEVGESGLPKRVERGLKKLVSTLSAAA